MKRRHSWLIGIVLGMATLGALGWAYFDWHDADQATPAAATPAARVVEASGPITPVPHNLALDLRKVALGDRLFHEGRLSGDGMVSCAHCHNLTTGGVDHQPRALGVGGQEGAINTPTVFNSSLNFRQFWDGRAQSLEDQVNGPLNNPLEMASSWPKALAVLSGDTSYQTEFARVYQDGITANNVRDAIATFERSLVTPNARFDLFLQGNQAALTEAEQAGYRLFKQIGCTSCHQGVAIGGNMYQKLGIMEDYFAQRPISATDLGRFNVTQKEEDRHFFKVPSLRNVAVTAPYLHDASAATLADAVRVMARYQLGKTLEPQEIASIVVFLQTLTGEYLGHPLQ
jgi:cytochrome c peroxidase